MCKLFFQYQLATSLYRMGSINHYAFTVHSISGVPSITSAASEEKVLWTQESNPGPESSANATPQCPKFIIENLVLKYEIYASKLGLAKLHYSLKLYELGKQN